MIMPDVESAAITVRSMVDTIVLTMYAKNAASRGATGVSLGST